jgi:hypothetical protein
MNRAVVAFKGKRDQKQKALGANKLQLWDEAIKFGNFVSVLKILE